MPDADSAFGWDRRPGVGDVPSTRERLVEAAARLFREKGYAASTTRELALELGIQKASLYHHIRSKEDLLYAISLESLRRITEAVAEVAATGRPNRLRATIETHIETALRDRDLHTTMLVELRSLSPERRARVRDARDAYEHLFQELIAAEQADGRLRHDIDARHLTLSLLNLLNWTIFWYDPAGDRTAGEIGAMLATIFLEGAEVPGP